MSNDEHLSYELAGGPAQNPDADVPERLQRLAAEAGVRINGRAPWDVQVHDPEVYRRILRRGLLGFGEAYLDDQWDAHELDELFNRLLRAEGERSQTGWARVRLLGEALRQRLGSLRSGRRGLPAGERHDDIGHDVFSAMLDPTMSYSCGYWRYADNLAQAQHDKLDMICRKLELRPGQHLLEIGCGWGGLARHAAKYFKVEVTGITVSKQQQRYAQERCAGLPVRIERMDYRDLRGAYDKVVSVGMLECVCPGNYATYFDTALRLMKDDGLFLLHTIGIHASSPTVDPWIDHHLFPNGRLPSARKLSAALHGRFVIEDWHNFGPDYDRTLMAWWHNFDAAWPQLESRYGRRFYRLWKYYLLSCAGFFRSRQGQLWQLVLSKRGRVAAYRSPR